MEQYTNRVKERALLEDAFEKLEKPCVTQTNHNLMIFPRFFLEVINQLIK